MGLQAWAWVTGPIRDTRPVDIERRRHTVLTNPVLPLIVRRNGVTFACDGIKTWQTRYGLVADVPRACLDDSRKVRVGVQMQTYYWSVAEQDEHRGQDDGLWDGKLKWGVPRLSPWVAAG